MDSTEIGVLEETDQIGLRGFLKSSNGRALEAEIGLEILGDFTNETLERELADQKLCRLLELTNLTESDGSGSESVGLLDASRGGVLAGLSCDGNID
jgi:histone H3